MTHSSYRVNTHMAYLNVFLCFTLQQCVLFTQISYVTVAIMQHYTNKTDK